jgi:UDP-glucose 4-epimerase
MNRFVVTGGAGFIGSHIIRRLLDEGNHVKALDKIPLEKTTRLKQVVNNPHFTYSQIDLSNSDRLEQEFKGYDIIVHFAAVSDISLGNKITDLDLKNGTIATYKILDAMRVCGIKKIIFSSSAVVYGYPSKVPTPEDAGMLFPASLYGASKLAAEGLISSYCYLFDIKSWIFRFGNVIGGDSGKGVIFDLINKLRKNQDELEILGDGEQVKEYIHVDDLVDGILYAFSKINEKINVFNIGAGILSVKEIVQIILDEMNLKNTRTKYTGGPVGWQGGGWAGDVRIAHYDTSKIKKLGWKPTLSATEAVLSSVREMLNVNKK